MNEFTSIEETINKIVVLAEQQYYAGRAFDMVRLDFLLILLYNNTHGTNYKIQFCNPINNDECTRES